MTYVYFASSTFYLGAVCHLQTLLAMAEKCKNPQEKSELIKTIKQLDSSISKLKVCLTSSPIGLWTFSY